jgi:RNA polymerase II subunit A small phosphatase-like protein
MDMSKPIDSSDQKLLILDLDETLVFASEEPLNSAAEVFELGRYWVYKRPHLSEFIDFCLAHFEVAVWTSGNESYATDIVKELFADPDQLAFVWSRKRCTRHFDEYDFSVEWIKNLKKVKRRGYSLDHTIMVDNTPRKLHKNYGNLVRIRDFEGDAEDTDLLSLMRYLGVLREVPNIRTIEKRGWLKNLATTG